MSFDSLKKFYSTSWNLLPSLWKNNLKTIQDINIKKELRIIGNEGWRATTNPAIIGGIAIPKDWIDWLMIDLSHSNPAY